MAEVGILPESGIELINGDIVEKDYITCQHAAMPSKLNHFLSIQLQDKAFIISIHNALIVNDFSEPEPDVAILKYRADFYGDEHPHGSDALLVIEIGGTSVAYDRKFKLPLYAEIRYEFDFCLKFWFEQYFFRSYQVSPGGFDE